MMTEEDWAELDKALEAEQVDALLAAETIARLKAWPYLSGVTLVDRNTIVGTVRPPPPAKYVAFKCLLSPEKQVEVQEMLFPEGPHWSVKPLAWMLEPGSRQVWVSIYQGRSVATLNVPVDGPPRLYSGNNTRDITDDTANLLWWSEPLDKPPLPTDEDNERLRDEARACFRRYQQRLAKDTAEDRQVTKWLRSKETKDDQDD